MLESTSKDSVSMTDDLTVEGTGISTPQSEMMMASFRVDRELWTKFGAIAKRERLTATDVLTDYIQRCTDNDKTEYAVSINTDTIISTDTYVSDKLNDAVMMIISTMSLPSKDDISTMISTAIDKALSVKPSTPDNSAIKSLVQAQIEPLADLLTELETYTQSQFKAVREELGKPLAIAR
jgi:hypothetical protein